MRMRDLLLGVLVTVIWGSNTVWSDPQSWADTVIWGSDTVGTSSGKTVIWGSTSGATPDTIAFKNVQGSTTSTGSSVTANSVSKNP